MDSGNDPNRGVGCTCSQEPLVQLDGEEMNEQVGVARSSSLPAGLAWKKNRIHDWNQGSRVKVVKALLEGSLLT